MDNTMSEYNAWTGRDLYDCNGDKIGQIQAVFYDDVSGRPEWLSVKTKMFGGAGTFVPIAGATTRGEGDEQDLQVRFSKDQIKDAPNVEESYDHLSAADEERLYRHYGFDWQNRDETHFGYGEDYAKAQRFDRDYKRQQPVQRATETVDQKVQTQAQVTVPVEANVRLRRYVTEGTKTETVTVPTTEEHVEVEGVQAQARPAGRNA